MGNDRFKMMYDNGDEEYPSSYPPAHSMKYAAEKRKRYVRIDLSGMSLSWRVIVMTIATITGGAGSLAGLHFASSTEVDLKIKTVSTKIIKNEDVRHKMIDSMLEDHNSRIAETESVIESVQKVQHMDIAVREARRVTAHIKPQSKRLDAIERIRKINMKRLASPTPKETCSTVDCTN